MRSAETFPGAKFLGRSRLMKTTVTITTVTDAFTCGYRRGGFLKPIYRGRHGAAYDNDLCGNNRTDHFRCRTQSGRRGTSTSGPRCRRRRTVCDACTLPPDLLHRPTFVCVTHAHTIQGYYCCRVTRTGTTQNECLRTQDTGWQTATFIDIRVGSSASVVWGKIIIIFFLNN